MRGVAHFQAEKRQRDQEREQGSEELRSDESGCICGPDACKGVRQRARNRDCWICERGRSSEPIGGSDPAGNHPGSISRSAVAQYDQQQAEGRHELGQPLSRSGAHVRRGLKQRQLEHRVRDERAKAAARHLHEHVASHITPRQLPSKPLDERNGGIEMGTADRSQKSDQRSQHGHCRCCISQQCHRHVSARQSFCHDARTDNCRCEEQRPEPLGKDAPRARHLEATVEVLPMASRRSCNFMRSSDANGRLVNTFIRLSSA